MDEFRNTAKTKEKYTEIKYGKYDAYSYLTNEDMVVEMILDSSDEDANIYLLVSVYVDDKIEDEKDLDAIFKSANIQKLLNSVSYLTETVD